MLDDPIAQFQAWYAEAQAASPGHASDMTLATADASGRPSARMVLLRGIDERGFLCFTNYASRKGRELDANPRAALVFHWRELDRQVRIEGAVERVLPETSDAYFDSRALGSRLSAIASPQSEVIESHDALEQRVRELAARYRHAHERIPRPEHWGGYRVVPESIEFWLAGPHRLHERVRYVRGSGAAWRIERLAP